MLYITHRPVFYLKHDTLCSGDRMQSPKRHVLTKYRMMDNVLYYNSYNTDNLATRFKYCFITFYGLYAF
jgi:hypothetical protein